MFNRHFVKYTYIEKGCVIFIKQKLRQDICLRVEILARIFLA